MSSQIVCICMYTILLVNNDDDEKRKNRDEHLFNDLIWFDLSLM